MRTTESIQWVIDAYGRKGYRGRPLQQKNNKNKFTKEARRLKYCKQCSHTWEIATSGVILFYQHLPTYGCKRKKCKRCKGNNIQAYKQRYKYGD